MDTDGIQGVQIEPEDATNDFVHHRKTGKLIGRVWQESNGEWWATFYLGERPTARNVSGGKFDTRTDAEAAVRAQTEEA
ncbi:hypothetical protein ACFV4E_23005 [Streptomyces hygroscopicus]|uniref:hypothetical protein n=1 Tax=Streptomyces hygroscopicus TaxID=1912 RepID=UPI00367A3D0B